MADAPAIDPTLETGEAAPPALLEARRLARSFPIAGRDVHALRGVDLVVRRGETHVLTGPSGSGKSTLVYLLGALDSPTEGWVAVEGKHLDKLADRDLALLRREAIGFVFQSHNLLPALTALENAMLPAIPAAPDPAIEQRARALLQRVGLGDRLDHHPKQLSGGEQQRVALVRALVMQPRLVLADEPTGELDSTTGGEVIALLRELTGDAGAGLVIVTHDLGLLAPGDVHHAMRDGQIESTRVVATPDR